MGRWLGFIGVAIFALTLPLTRLAVREFDPLFLAIGRTVVAAAVALPLLVSTRQPRPDRQDVKQLLFVVAGVIFGFPVLSAMAMRSAPAAHGSVVLGALPLATALMSTIFAHERPSRAFWLWSLAGSSAVITFALWDGGAELHAADSLLVLAVLAASMGYAAGGQLAKKLGGWQVICWALLLALPITLPITLYLTRQISGHESLIGWACFAYLGLMSQLVGFFAWNKGLAHRRHRQSRTGAIVAAFHVIARRRVDIGRDNWAAHNNLRFHCCRLRLVRTQGASVDAKTLKHRLRLMHMRWHRGTIFEI